MEGITPVVSNIANNIENESYNYETPNHLSCNTFRDLHNSRKWSKTRHTHPVMVVLTKPLKALFDSGTSATIVNKKFCEKLKCKPVPKTLWKTKGGNFTTNQKVHAIFKLTKFDERKAVEWECHVDGTKGQQSYDMIIGCKLLEELGMILDYKQCVMTWEDAEVPMKSTDYEIEETYSM